MTTHMLSMQQPHFFHGNPPHQQKSQSGSQSTPRIFFAGDYLADGWNGFMDGAIESGLRAAHQVTEALGRPQAPLQIPELDMDSDE